MKPKILFSILAIFAFIIFISVLINIWINLESISIKPQDKETTPQQAINEAPVIIEEQAQEPLPASATKPAITVIKPAEKETLAAPKQGMQQINKPLSRSAKSSPPLQSRKENSANEPVLGISETYRYPSEAENKEMKERGIVIW